MIRTLAATTLALGLAAPALAQPAGEEVAMTSFPTEDPTAPDPETVQGWVMRYFEGTRSGDATTWAQAFAPDAVVDDPVGAPLKTTPEAILAQGEAFVAAFEEIGLHETFVHVVGREAVAHWEGRGTTPDGQEVAFEGVNLFTFDDEGRITELRGFFAPPGG